LTVSENAEPPGAEGGPVIVKCGAQYASVSVWATLAPLTSYPTAQNAYGEIAVTPMRALSIPLGLSLTPIGDHVRVWDVAFQVAGKTIVWRGLLIAVVGRE
jgi:hypothetical protein